jgi:hypothetical protein
MNIKNKNTCYIYKNDLKFNENLDIESSEFESDAVKLIYNNFKSKPKIELRLEDSKMENYRYLDLSKLEINDKYFSQLLELKKITNILSKIEFMDLSNNNLTKLPDLKKFSNIVYLNVSFNSIDQDIVDDNLIELTCHNNSIKSIKSKKITHLNASDNLISLVDIPNIKILIISYNKIDWISSYVNLVYLECIENNIINIDNMYELEELYIGNNNVSNIKNMPNLKVLNCVGNPIDKIKYFPNLKTLMSSTCKISSQYILSNMEKIKSDYLINFKI